MFAKLFSKNSSSSHQKREKMIDLNPRVIVHYGIPSTASRLAHDPIQQLLAVATLDGRIKVIGGDNIEGLLMSPKEVPFKNLEFMQNQGFLVSVSNENDVQVWDLEHRCIAAALEWKSNITAFAVIQGTNFMYLGDDCGLVSVLKYDAEERQLTPQPYCVAASSVSEAAEISSLNHQSVVGILPQPCSSGTRVLFAYENGAIVLWDVSKNQLVHHMKNGPVENSVSSKGKEKNHQMSDGDQEDKEIVSLCWASLDGSVLAVGYVDGDILLWKLSGIAASDGHQKAGEAANNVVKLQLSSANRRFPVIVLHWSTSALCGDDGGLLFVYGGDEIGSAEVLTILSLEWSPRREALKSVVRINITVQGSFADMILLQNLNTLESRDTTSLFILSSPGQLHFYDSIGLSRLISQKDGFSAPPINYKSAIPTTEPSLTVGRLISTHRNIKWAESLSKSNSTSEVQGEDICSEKGSNWPLRGGVPCHLPQPETDIKRLYVAGYQDGCVRIWDATYPSLSPLLILDPEARGVTVASVTTSVSTLDFCSETAILAVGNDDGSVCLYNLCGNYNQSGSYIVTLTKTEVHDLGHVNRPHLSAVFTLCDSPVRSMKFAHSGAKLVVGYESGQVAMLEMHSFTVLHLLDPALSPTSYVASFSRAIHPDICGLTTCLDQSEPQEEGELAKELIFALTSDLGVAVVDCCSGKILRTFSMNHDKDSTAISLYILGDAECVNEVSCHQHENLLSSEDEAKAELVQSNDQLIHTSDGGDISNLVQSSVDLQILLCCTYSLQLMSLKSVIQGHADFIHQVSLQKACCWTSILKKDEKESDLVLFYQTGSIEIRSLRNLEVLEELSLLAILRWNFKTNMDKTMSCTENGQITLANGCEFAVVSLLARENDFRVPQSLPCMHDKALAAALDLNSSPQQKKEKGNPSGILGGIVNGLRASKEAQNTDPIKDQKSIHASLEEVFTRSSAAPSVASKVAGDVVELDIDDIEIDGPLRILPVAKKPQNETRDKGADRKKLFDGASTETNARPRTVDEIKAKYRKAGDASSAASSAASAASEARNKLRERGEKLEKISQNSEELRNGAENFASMAKELAKRMENRKWWQL